MGQMNLLQLTKLFAQGICIFIFVLLTSYVFLFGKKGSGLHRDYLITSLILLFILWRLS
ncbi:hypothetical protein D3C81_1029290 [compost metagenome]